MEFKDLLLKRHACKLFGAKKIDNEKLKFILEAGVLTPSSHGFEPWKFLVISDESKNKELSKLCWGQENVATASHNIIILARTDLQSKDEFAQKSVRRFTNDAKFPEVLKLYTAKNDAMNKTELYNFAKHQCYLALMQMSLAAMSVGVDSCMIGGFEKEKVDEFLGLKAPFETAVILSLGFRANEPKYSKQRFKFDDIVEFI